MTALASKSALRNVDHFFVRHTRFEAARQQIDDLIACGRASSEAECLLVTGPPGTGKSTLRKTLERDYKPLPDGMIFRPPGSPTDLQADRILVVVLEMPSRPTLLLVLRLLLQKLGDENWNKGRLDEVCAKVDAFLRACGTVLIVFDEVQRLVDSAGVVTSEAVVEEIKRIHGEHGIGIVFLGLGRIRYLFDQDPQLRDRWSVELRLERFRCFEERLIDGEIHIVRNESEWAEWVGILKALQQTAEIKADEELASELMAKRFFFATGGVLRRLKILLKLTLRTLPAAIEPPILTLDALRKAYEGSATRVVVHNPFSEEFPNDMPPPLVEDDYALRPRPEQRRAHKKATAKSGSDLGAQIAAALRRER